MHKVKGFVPHPTVMAFDSGSDFRSLGLGYGAAVPWKKSVPGTSPEQLPRQPRVVWWLLYPGAEEMAEELSLSCH